MSYQDDLTYMDALELVEEQTEIILALQDLVRNLYYGASLSREHCDMVEDVLSQHGVDL